MASLEVTEVATFDEFLEAWGDSETALDETQLRLLWQLIGQLDEDELLVRIPKWLAEDRAAHGTGAAPTAIVGRMARETEKAVLLEESFEATKLTTIAHSIDRLERDEGAGDRNEWLDRRLAEHRQTWAGRYDEPGLTDGWLPKSQILKAVRGEG